MREPDGRGGNPVSETIDRVNGAVGRAVAWCALALVAVQFVAVVQRYVFGIGWIWVEESIVYLHATLFMAGAAYTLLHEGHVRVDIFYAGADARQRAWVDLIGTVAFLWPLSGLICVKAWPYVLASWQILERSPETSGIPAVFLLKSLLLVFAALIALQGVSMAAKAIDTIGAPPDGEGDGGHGGGVEGPA
ncbi:MAG: TRAP transporter small permease subunit [Alphaproteobacteria bacterium]|nr:TRAP transporter small permease subunit [Alphaproteobacteria bacterium]